MARYWQRSTQIWCHFLLQPTYLCLAVYLYSFNHWAKKYIYIYIYIYMCVCVCVCVYIYIYIVIQQNSFILMSGDLEILITWHLRRADPKPKGSAFYQQRASLMKEADLRHLFVYSSKCLSLSPDLFSWTPASSPVRTLEDTHSKFLWERYFCLNMVFFLIFI
jgi:hypothetical protein